MALQLRQTVLDCPDAPALAEFYRRLLGWDYPAGRVPAPDDDWVNLRNPDGGVNLAFQQTQDTRPSTWPSGEVPQQLHFDISVGSAEELTSERARIEGLGAKVIFDRFADPEEPLYVFADPAGHPFCVFVSG